MASNLFRNLINYLGLCFLAGTSAWAAPPADTLRNGLDFPLYVWQEGLTEPKAIVVAIHGATLHGRSFDALAKRLAQNGYLVLSSDIRGFGAWCYEKPELKLSRHILYRQSQADIQKLLDKLHDVYPGQCIFLVGESLGANMAIRLLAANPQCADGMILSSPAIKQRFFLGPTVLKQLFTVMVKPGSQLSVEPYIKSRISEDPKIVDERIKDPLSRNHMNVGELFKTRWFNKDAIKLAPNLSKQLPVLILEGTEDRLFAAQDVEKLMAQLQSQDKRLYWLKHKGHINLETAYLQPEVVQVINEWLTSKISKTAKFKGPENKVSFL